MNKFAQILNGKVIYIYETEFSMADLALIFTPATVWVDVTNCECEVGYIAEFRDGVGLVVVPPKDKEYTLNELKVLKIAEFKAKRDALEVEPIEYNGSIFDFDEKARDRINSAIIALDLMGENATIEWTTADNTNVTVTANDLRTVIANVAIRSNELHVKYRNLKERIEKCNTKEELDSIKWEDASQTE